MSIGKPPTTNHQPPTTLRAFKKDCMMTDKTRTEHRKSMPGKQEIHKFWLDAYMFKWKGIEISDDIGACYACGDAALLLDRAHINPMKSDGSNNGCNNLHLLCKKCHAESETYEGNIYWSWLVNKNQNEYKTHYEWVIHRLRTIDGYFDHLVDQIDDKDPELFTDSNIQYIKDAINNRS